MSDAFKLDSPLYSAFANALQGVLQREVADRETAIAIWLQIQDLPEFGAIVRDEAKYPGAGWISVNDDLPVVGRPVLGFVYGSRCGSLQEEPDEFDVVYIKTRREEPFWVHRGDDHLGLNVTHWRELPEQPKSE